VCCSVLQCVAVCCSMCCGVSQCVAVGVAVSVGHHVLAVWQADLSA